MTMGLTERQSDVVRYVRTHIETKGSSPSYAEIAQHIGVRNRGRVFQLVTDLVERGALIKIPGKARTLALPPPSIGTGLIIDPHPEVRRELEAYAAVHRISVKTAAEEALRAYFVEVAR